MEDYEPTIFEHTYQGFGTGQCTFKVDTGGTCGAPARQHADPGDSMKEHLIVTHPHPFIPQEENRDACGFTATTTGETDLRAGGTWRVCGYPRDEHPGGEAYTGGRSVVKLADVAQYAREPMPDAARRGPVVTLIDAPVDPLGTLAVVVGIYEGRVRRSKAEVTDEERRAALEAMQATVLSGPLEAVQFTFLIEGVSRSITHQMVRNRFAFFAQESLRFAVAEDWAQEVPLPPSLAGAKEDDPRVGLWRKAMNASEDHYNALVGAGLPAEEARGVLAHDITTRLYMTVSLRSLLQEAGKRTCTQAQFPWRTIFAGVAKAFRERAYVGGMAVGPDSWQYRAFADLIRPVCYQQGKCGFMSSFDRGCKIRARVDEHERKGEPSSEWHDIDPREWAADPSAARVVDGAVPNEPG